jgi:pyruvate dehydrogenase E2 component (dihydrolipoamide acetyltransferase)
MATVIRMPSVLAGATEAAIARWLVSPGDTVTAGTPIAEIETEKALVEYAAEEAGVVGRLVLGEGGTGEIGDPIAVLVAAGETDAEIDAALGGAGAAKTAPPAPAAVPEAGGTGPAANGHLAPANGGRIFASPLVRKLAGERGIDLAGLAGTGPNGRIVRRDLERFLAAGPPVPATPAQLAAGVPAPAPSAPVTGAAAARSRPPARRLARPGRPSFRTRRCGARSRGG